MPVTFSVHWCLRNPGHLRLEEEELEEEKPPDALMLAIVLVALEPAYTNVIPGHLRLEDEGFEEKKPPEARVLPIVLGVLEPGSTNANRDIVGTGIFVRLFVSTSRQNR